jgi:hypothetical protein
MAQAGIPLCLDAIFDSPNDLLLEDVVDSSGAPLPGGTVSAEVFDVDDLLTVLVGPVVLADDGGGDYSAPAGLTPTAILGFFVGQRIKIVYDFDGPGAGDDRIFNVIAIVVEG